MTQTVERPDQPVGLDNLIVECARTGPMTTLADAYANACPGPIADLGLTLGESELISLTQRWQLDVPPALEIRTSAIATPTTSLSTSLAPQAFAGAIVADVVAAASGADGGHDWQSRPASACARRQ